MSKNTLHVQVLKIRPPEEGKKKKFGGKVPAPNTTLVMPLHIVNAPSVEDIRDTACVIPVYTAVGVGLTTCIRVLHSQLTPLQYLFEP